MKVLITGGAGFVGGALAGALASEGVEVDIADNFSRGSKDGHLRDLIDKEAVRLVDADLTNADGLGELSDDYDYIYHLAAIIGVRNVMEKPQEVLWNNVAMMGHLLNYARRQKSLKRFVFASTSEVYAGSLQHLDMAFPTPETTPIALTDLAHPRTSYMLSKLYGEAMCQLSDLPVTIVRPHNFYGPRMGMSHVIPELLARAYRCPPGEGLEVFSPDHLRTFCFIDDAVRLVRALAESDGGLGGTFNVGVEEPEYNILQVAQIVLQTVGVSLDLIPGETHAGSPARRSPDMTATHSVVDARAEISLSEGIERTWAWYRERLDNPALEMAV
jgi:UDP-glucose 4-epimerase